MIAGKGADRGQVFPLYVVVIVAMLFAALALFVFGQAAVVRSDAQGAADAAALAAAREARDHLVPGLDLSGLKPEDWKDVLEGKSLDMVRACQAAGTFAKSNDATGTCKRSSLEFTVEATTDRTVGDSVVPGTRGTKATAIATAEIVPRCALGPTPSPVPTSTPAPGEPPTPGPVGITCKGGRTIEFDPLHPDPWSALARKLFDVRLVQ